MSVNSHTKPGLFELLSKHEDKLVSEWAKEQSATPSRRGAQRPESDIRKQCKEFIGLLCMTLESDGSGNIESPGWTDLREMLEHLSRSRTVEGCSPSETASFVFSLKKPLFDFLAP